MPSQECEKEYVHAVSNEHAVDSFVYFSSGRGRFYGMPRPLVWINKSKILTFFLRVTSVFIFSFWVLFGFWIYILVDFFRTSLGFFIYHSKNHFCDAGYEKIAIKDAAICVPFSLKSTTSIKQAFFCDNRKNYVWLDIPWANCLGVEERLRVVNLYSIMRFSDLLCSLMLSFKACFFILLRVENKLLIMQSYTVFKWFCVRKAIERFPDNDIIIAEHFDRWAVLFDTYQGARINHDSCAGFKIVQHGLLSNVFDLSATGFGFDLPYRLKFVNDIFCYDDKQRSLFLSSVLDSSCESANFHFFRPLIYLEDIEKRGCPSVLFIGNPLCELFHFSVFDFLIEKRSVDIYYKPHPVAVPSPSIYEKKWCVIDNKEFFPRVDLIVSYPSTLVYEYACHGVRAVEHPINASVSSAERVANDVGVSLSEMGL